MDATFKNFGNNAGISQSTIIWAVVSSFLLHVIFFVVVPNFKLDLAENKPRPLTIEIMQPVPPAPIVLPEPVQPQPAKLEPAKPVPIKKSKPITEPIKPLEQKSFEPAPTQDISAEPVTAEPPPNVIAVAPKIDTAPEIKVAPPPEVQKKVEPSKAEMSDADVSDAKAQYGNTLSRAIARHKSYPKIAQMRGWQGECLLDLQIDANGKVLSANVKESSGHDSLDNQALEMVRKASPFPAPPEALRGRSFNITVPVSFKLDNV